jgi:GTP cyclohydrolase I
MKTDYQLGLQVHEYLKQKGVETPMHQSVVEQDKDVRILTLTNLFRDVWNVVGLDLTDDSLCETPARMAKMYIKEIYKGLDYHNFPKCTAVDNKMGYDEMVVEPRCNVQSNCEHHGVVISGYASVAYIPNKRVIGLSKINRIVEFFSKRPQIQERLTEQIFHALSYILDTENVAVVVSAEHYCVKSRGVEDVGAYTVTSKLGGTFRNTSARQEFLALSRQNQV